MSADEAFEILRERRGTMYDPLVVDTFIRAYPEIAPLAIRAGQEARTVFDIELSDWAEASVSQPLQQIRATSTETAILVRCNQNVAKAVSVKDALRTAAQSLRQLLPATVYALFEYESQSDSLVCDNAVGDPQNLLGGLTIPVGQRVTGWCGANRRTAMNSDASLDLAQIAQLFQPPLRSTISTPLIGGDRLIAVLTAYSLMDEAFTESHRYAFEQASSALLERISSLQSKTSSNLVSFPIHKS